MSTDSGVQSAEAARASLEFRESVRDAMRAVMRMSCLLLEVSTGGDVVDGPHDDELGAWFGLLDEVSSETRSKASAWLRSDRAPTSASIPFRRELFVEARAERAAAIRGPLVDLLTPSLSELDPVPYATVEQARRLASLKAALLQSGAFTYDALTEGWGVGMQAVRQRVRRLRLRNELFTVTHDGEVLVPAFLLDQQMEIRSSFGPVIETLRSAGEDGWALWAWFSTPSAWLDGQVPAEVIDSDLDMVVAAASRRASNYE